MGLIDALPYLALNLATAAEDLLRTLFEVTQLTIRIDARGDRATLEITLPEDQLPEVSGAADPAGRCRPRGVGPGRFARLDRVRRAGCPAVVRDPTRQPRLRPSGSHRRGIRATGTHNQLVAGDPLYAEFAATRLLTDGSAVQPAAG